MNDKPENPSAFPTSRYEAGKYIGKYQMHNGEEIDQWESDGLRHYNGMTLRDYFADTALLALMRGPCPLDKKGRMIAKTPTNVSLLAYEYADAMLKARESK